MATTVQTSVTDNQATSPFYYLRITGFPYYFFATINPSSTRYGSFAWSTPTDYSSSTWAQQGLQLPDGMLEQKLSDIIGGIATSARITLSVIDFPDPNRVGYKFFSRLFAPGRAASDTSITKSRLDNPVSSIIGADSVIEVAGQTGTWTVPSDVYIGGETIGIDLDTDLGSGAHELQIADRNKYVCYGNSADGGNYWPPQPYHRITFDPSGNTKDAPFVTAEAMDAVGRTAALWMGHMRPDGNPEPETSSTCLLLGRITDIGIGKTGGMFDITIESVVADLNKGKVAPDLGHGTIQDGFYLNSSGWTTFYLWSVVPVSDPVTITIAADTYDSPRTLANAVTAAIAATGVTWMSLDIVKNGDDDVFAFVSRVTQSDTQFFVSSAPINSTASPTDPGAKSLLHALGFDPSASPFEVSDSGSTGGFTLMAQRPVARVFVPMFEASEELTLAEGNGAVSYFYTDQGDGTSQAWGVYGDGQMVKITAASGSTITTGSGITGTGIFVSSVGDDPGWGKFYYVERTATATLDQVLVYQASQGGGTYTAFLGRMLASTKGHSSASDGLLNVFPEGVGMGWKTIMTAVEWLLLDELGLERHVIVNHDTKFLDLFRPYAREHGLFLCWNPSTSLLALRRVVMPSPASAGTNVSFTESNRAKPDDRTSQRIDRSNIRTSWKLQTADAIASVRTPINAGLFKWTFDILKATPGSILILNDVRARSMYPNDDRQEEIVDDSLIMSPGVRPLVDHLLELYSAPWTLCQRSMNKRGMLLSPGTVHQIVDNTLVNPYTGATGITSSDAVYGLLTRVSMRPSDGSVTVEFVINSTDDPSLYRQWSPTALVDFTMNSLGYTNGYNSGTKTLFTVQKYGQSALGDSTDFAAGDTVRIINRDSGAGGVSASQTDTIASTSTGTITLTTGISALSVVSETIVILQKYNSATTTRKTGATRVAWQGNGDTHTIQGSSTARLNRWS